eukprot:9313352-Prorocentrum_lima.AAC.1
MPRKCKEYCRQCSGSAETLAETRYGSIPPFGLDPKVPRPRPSPPRGFKAKKEDPKPSAQSRPPVWSQVE